MPPFISMGDGSMLVCIPLSTLGFLDNHDEVIKWKHFPRYWPFVWGIHRSPVNSPHKGQWRDALMFSLICTWINGWVNNGEAGDLRRHRAHHDVIVIISYLGMKSWDSQVCDRASTITHVDREWKNSAYQNNKIFHFFLVLLIMLHSAIFSYISQYLETTWHLI